MKRDKHGLLEYLVALVRNLIILLFICFLFNINNMRCNISVDRVLGCFYKEYQGEIVNQCDASDRFLTILQKKYDSLPESLRTSFKERGYHIEVVDQITDVASYAEEAEDHYSFVGVFRPMESRIEICYKHYDNTIYHEMGHYYSSMYDLLDEEFIEIFDEGSEVQALCNYKYSKYYSLSYKEFYAECFSMYITNPRKLKHICPNTYEIIKYDYDNMDEIINAP